MNQKYIIAAAAAVVVIAVGYILLTPASNTSGDATLASLLPTETIEDLETAQEGLSYTLQAPTYTAGAELSDIKVGQVGVIDDSDTLYLTYTSGSNTVFKVAESTAELNDPDGGEMVSINGVDAYYISLGGEEEGGVSIGNAATPTSYLFWYADGVRFEVSEFGTLSMEELMKIAGSMQTLN